jgi:nucleoside-diphosphate-sugar epimerase
VLSRRDDVTVVRFDRKRNSFETLSTLKEFVRGADVVFHLAGVKGGDSAASYRFNVESTASLLAAMREAAPDALLVFASSFSVYGPLRSAGGFTERSTLRPRTAYGKSKRSCERLIELSCRKYGSRAVALRISNVYGPRTRGHDSIVARIQQTLSSGAPLHLTGTGEQTRDFIFVDDVVRALIAAMEKRIAGSNFQVFNICSGTETSIRTLVRIAEKEAQTPIRLQIVAGGAGSSRSSGSFRKAKDALGWRPLVSLRRGILLNEQN